MYIQYVELQAHTIKNNSTYRTPKHQKEFTMRNHDYKVYCLALESAIYIRSITPVILMIHTAIITSILKRV